jgi:hypothetical protein
MSTTALSFYDHHRQSYGALPLRDGLAGEFHVGGYDESGVGDGGEFSIGLVGLRYDQHGGSYMLPVIRAFSNATESLRTFLDGDAWYLICVAADAKEIRSRDDLTALLIRGGLQDRSDNPVGHIAVCSCCGRPTEGEQR